VVGLVALAGCVSAVVQPVPADLPWATAQWPEVTLASLQTGRDRYIRKCAGCHNLHVPSEFPPTRWPKLVASMAERSHLTADDEALIMRYLSTASARGPAASP